MNVTTDFRVIQDHDHGYQQAYPRAVTLTAAVCAILFSIVGVLGMTNIQYSIQ